MKSHTNFLPFHCILLLSFLCFNLSGQESTSDNQPQIQYLIASNPTAARAGAEPVGNMGSLAFPISLELPPSRSQTEPEVQLVYNSSNQTHGSFVGQSWSLQFGAIRRSLKDGVPAYTDDDVFEISLGKAQGELVRIDTRTDTLEYRVAREKLFLIVYFLSTANRWVAIDKKGIQYHFGQTTGSRIENGPDKIFEWELDKVFTPQFNHTISYTYTKSANQIYPQLIDYFHGQVEFSYVAHPQPFRSFKTGFSITTNRLLSEIATFYREPDTVQIVTFLPAAIYKLRYANQQCSVDEFNSIVRLTPYLQSITRYNGTKTDSLPPTTFTYDDQSLSLARAQRRPWLVPLISGAGFTEDDGDGNNALEIVDVNGDGFPDLLHADGDDQRMTLLNNQEDGWDITETYRFPVLDNGGFTEDDGTGDNGVRLVDVNRDGFVDIVQADGATQRTTRINNKTNSWTTSASWPFPVIAGGGFTEDDGDGDNGVRFADVNNDGFIDIVQADGDDQRATFLNNTSDAWVNDTVWIFPVIAGGGFTEDDGDGDNGVRLADVNNDGYVDIVQADGDDQRATFINNPLTNTWEADTRWIIPVIAGGGFTEDDGEDDNGVRLGDVNGDGYVDILQADGAGQRAIFLNDTVGGWVADSRWEIPVIAGGGFTEDDGEGDNGVRLADINHDGYIDIVVADGNAPDQHLTYLNNTIDGWILVSLPLSRLDFEGNWSASSDWQVPVMDKGGFNEQDGSGNNGVRLADVNADGYIDILQADGNDSDQHITFLNNRKDGWELTPLWQIPVLDNGGFTEDDGGGDNAVQITELNNDGFPDLLQGDGDDRDQHLALLNDGIGGWKVTPGWAVPIIDNGGFTESDGDGDNGVRIADVNGDGFPDLIQADGDAQRAVFLNDRSGGWVASTLHAVPDIDNGGFTEGGGDNDNGVRLVDVNGDGLVDIVQADDAEQREVFLNTGNGGWFTTSDWRLPEIHDGGFTEDGGDDDNGVRFADLNFDGFIDLIQADGDDQRDVYLNNGFNGWVKVTSWQVPKITQGGFTEDDGEGDNGLNISDVNGDGFPDLIQGDGLLERRTYLNAMTRPPLLQTIDNGIGGIIDIEYEAHPGRPIVYTVSRITESDGFDTHESRFEFLDPYFDIREREFRGFGRTHMIADGAIVESFYHQANGDSPITFERGDSLGMEGYVYLTRICKEEDPNVIYQAHRDQWSLSVNRSFPEYHIVQLESEISYDFASEGISHTASAKTYNYDDAGNVTRLTDCKYVADDDLSGNFLDLNPSDNVITVTEYAQDTAEIAFVRGFPSRVMAQDINGAILKESRFIYDSLSYGKIATGLPSMEQAMRVYTDYELYPRNFVSNTDPSSPDHVPYMDTIATFVYDTLGNIVERTNPNGDRKYYAYDSTGLFAVSDSIVLTKGKPVPIALVNTYAYDRSTGLSTRVTAPNGAVCSKVYDAFGRLLSVAESAPNDVTQINIKETFTYELGGAAHNSTSNRIVHTMAQDGIAVKEQEITFLDGFYRKVQVKTLMSDAQFNGFSTISYTYLRGDLIESTFQPYFTTGDVFTTLDFSKPHFDALYDAAGRRIGAVPVHLSEGDSPMTGETRQYTIEGVQRACILRKGTHETKYVYNSNGQVTDIYQTNGRRVFRTQYFYDVLDRLIRIVDEHGAVTTFFYDSMGEKREMVDATTGHASYTYDGAGNVLTYVDAKQDTTFFIYDELYRLLAKEFSADPAETIKYTFDEDGNVGLLTTLQSRNVNSAFKYDVNGHVVAHLRKIQNEEFVIETQYDPYGRLLAITYPNGRTVKYSHYTSGGLLKEVSMDGQPIAFYERYSELAKPVKYEYGNSVTTENTFFESNQRVQEMSVKDEVGGEILGFAYRFDDYGNVRFVHDRILKTRERYAYDDLNRLTSWDKWEGANPLSVLQNFQYDAIGNIVSKDGVPYEYEEARPYILAKFGTQTIKHDENGNQTVGVNGRKYTYDVMGRLVEVRDQNNAPLVSYGYDSANGRVFKKSPANGLTIFIDNLYEHRQQGNLNTVHVYAHGILIASMVIPRETSRQRIQYYHHDHLGSIAMITDVNGHVVSRFDYTPYGEQTQVTGTLTAAFGFTGQPVDSEVGLLYYQSRYYDPVLGRFLQPDRIIPRPEDPQTLNRYAYVGNNPITFVDPTGHWFGWDDLVAAGVGFAVGFTVGLIASDFDLKVAFAAGFANAVTFWVAYSTFGLGGAIFIGSAQLASVASNEVFAGARGGAIGDAIQLVTTFAASPVTSTVGLLVGTSFILLTDRTWEKDFHFVDGSLWFQDPFRGKAAMTTGAVVHYDNALGFKESRISHELIHRRQFGFVGDGFVPIYFLDIGIRMVFGQSSDAAYRSSVFESEAYGKQDRHGHLGASGQEAIDVIQLFDRNVLVTAPGRF